MLKIMIVDDSVMVRKILRKQLEKLGHTVVGEAKSGIEATILYSKVLPDIVTMDITMPGISGVEAVKRIVDKHKDAKIIMITSHGEEAYVMDAIGNGAKAYILKPINEDKLIESIIKVFPDLYGG